MPYWVMKKILTQSNTVIWKYKYIFKLVENYGNLVNLRLVESVSLSLANAALLVRAATNRSSQNDVKTRGRD